MNRIALSGIIKKRRMMKAFLSNIWLSAFSKPF